MNLSVAFTSGTNRQIPPADILGVSSGVSFLWRGNAEIRHVLWTAAAPWRWRGAVAVGGATDAGSQIRGGAGAEIT